MLIAQISIQIQIQSEIVANQRMRMRMLLLLLMVLVLVLVSALQGGLKHLEGHCAGALYRRRISYILDRILYIVCLCLFFTLLLSLSLLTLTSLSVFLFLSRCVCCWQCLKCCKLKKNEYSLNTFSNRFAEQIVRQFILQYVPSTFLISTDNRRRNGDDDATATATICDVVCQVCSTN